MNKLHRVKRFGWQGAKAFHNFDSLRKSQNRANQVLNYVNEHFSDSTLSLAQVAGAIGKNEKYLAHLFVQQFGQRMHTYITALRLRHSCELLLQTAQTIEQVTHASGFSSAAQFRQAFRHNVGVTASDYRQMFTSAG